MSVHAEVARSASSGRVRRRPRLLARLLVVFAALAAAMLLAEICLRVLGIGYGHAPLNGHARYHHWHPSNYVMTVWTVTGEFGGYRVHYNSGGFAMRTEFPPLGTPVVICLGDSFTESVQVPQDANYCAFLTEEIGIEALNFGCASFSPILERLLFEDHVDQVTPIAVSLQICENDLASELQFAALARHDGQGRIIAVSGERTSIAVQLARRSYLARLARKVWQTRQYSEQRAAVAAGRSGFTKWERTFLQPIRESVDPRAIERFEASVREIEALCRARNLPLLIWVVPNRAALTEGSADYMHEYVEDLAARMGVRYLDMPSAFAKYDARNLFFKHDGHFTAAGHAIVAQVLGAALADPPSPE